MKVRREDGPENEQYFVGDRELSEAEHEKVKEYVAAMSKDLDPPFKELVARINVGSSGMLTDAMLLIADKDGRVATVISTLDVPEQRAALSRTMEMLGHVKKKKEN